VIIVHTSGSTGLLVLLIHLIMDVFLIMWLLGAPKPVYYTNEWIGICDLESFIPDYDGRKTAGQNLYADYGIHYLMASPFFHLSGLHSGLVPLLAGPTMVIPPSNAPANASVILEILGQIDIQTVGLPPSIYEEISSTYRDEFLKVTKHLKFIIYGGGKPFFSFTTLQHIFSTEFPLYNRDLIYGP
jgi:hypothetical protein